MRTLASLQRIKAIEPIEGADAIEVATVLGWHVVVKKGEFFPGSLCVYFEIDSVLPPRPEFEFLAPKYRIKTVRLRGQISQGICFPVTILGPNFPYTSMEEGDDLTDILEVKKYEPPTSLEMAGLIKGQFPGFIPRTDETRIQSYPEILEKYQDMDFYVSEKLDGTSMTVYFKDGEFGVCSRNLDFKEESNNALWQMAKELQLDKKMHLNGINLAIQGEFVGEGIQKNTLKIKGKNFYAFSIFNINIGEYVNYESFVSICRTLKIETVPIIRTDYKLPKTVDEIVAYATRKSEINPNGWCEGIVLRPLKEMQDPDLGRLSFKVINPEFLLKHGE